MKKSLLFTSCFLLFGCSPFASSVGDFDTLYTRNILSSVERIDTTIQSFGFFSPFALQGVIDMQASVPVVFSGMTSVAYDLESDAAHNIAMNLTTGKAHYTGLTASGGISFDRVGLRAQDGNLYFSYKNIESTEAIPSEITDILSRYNDIWLSWTQADSEKSITDPEESQAFESTKNLSKLQLTDITKALSDYPIWKPTKDLGMSGSLHVWEVEMHRSNVIQLIIKSQTYLSGSGVTQGDRDSLEATLSGFIMTGTVAYDPQDASRMDSYLNLASTGGVLIGSVHLQTTQAGTNIRITDISSDTQILLDSQVTSDHTVSTLSMTQSGQDLGKASLDIEDTDGKFKSLILDITAQGVGVTLKHTMKDDESFIGNLLLPVGSISWNGTYPGNRLTSLKVQGASPIGAFDLALSGTTDRIYGPLTVRAEGQEVLRAYLGLVMIPDVMRISLDIPQGTGVTNNMVHGEFGVTVHKKSPPDHIDTPSPTRPLQEFFDAFDAITPHTDGVAPAVPNDSCIQ